MTTLKKHIKALRKSTKGRAAARRGVVFEKWLIEEGIEPGDLLIRVSEKTVPTGHTDRHGRRLLVRAASEGVDFHLFTKGHHLAFDAKATGGGTFRLDKRLCVGGVQDLQLRHLAGLGHKAAALVRQEATFPFALYLLPWTVSGGPFEGASKVFSRLQKWRVPQHAHWSAVIPHWDTYLKYGWGQGEDLEAEIAVWRQKQEDVLAKAEQADDPKRAITLLNYTYTSYKFEIEHLEGWRDRWQ